MPRVRSIAAAAVAAGSLAGCGGAAEPDRAAERPRAPARSSFSLAVVARGLSEPVHAAAPRNEPGRLYVVEKGGAVRVVENGQVRGEPFLDLRGRVSTGYEQGLLSIAFHPRYASNRRFYVNYTDGAGDTRVVEYRSEGGRALPGSARQVLFVDQPYANHNGGQAAFGPDGRLYVGMGDGGSQGDPENRAQNLRSRLGKLLAIDVDRRGATPQVVALGLRNPWRFSFDRATGDLYIGDVGSSVVEEINYLPRRSPGLENFGWDIWEGRQVVERKQRGPGRLVWPVVTYGRSLGASVAGGFVYRGSAVPAARGRYFYGDVFSGRVWSLRVVRGKATGVRQEPLRVQTGGGVSEGLVSFGEDARGELYLVSMGGGTIYRLAR